MLFGEASERQLTTMMSVLNQFCDASGEKISLSKSKMLVSSNVDHNKALSLSHFCQIPLTKDFGKYLGAPMIHGRITRQTYTDLLSKMQARLSAWENKHLSMAGRVTLAQSVLSALPNYLMQTLFLPEHVVNSIDKMIRRFVWGEHGFVRKMHTLSWDKICLPKEYGGLNVRDTRKVNLALMAKLGWSILEERDCLWIDIMKHKYMKGKDLFSLAYQNTDSSTWKSILKGRDLFLFNGIGICVNNGRTTRFWSDPWLPCGALIHHALQEVTENEFLLFVADYCTLDGIWKWDLLREKLPDEVLHMMASVSVDPTSDVQDSLLWKFSPDGKFTTQPISAC